MLCRSGHYSACGSLIGELLLLILYVNLPTLTLQRMRTTFSQWLSKDSALLGLFVLVLSFFTYFWNFTNPPYLYWDENYHIASGQKYLSGVYFMEPHPPLGKLMIALGEKLVNANPEDDQFIGTDYAKDLPEGFSFFGYRLFPVLFGWLIAPLLYLTFLLITRKPIWATLLSFLYIFDNALITHSRAAMLDSTMLFFCMAMIALYYLILKHKEHKNKLPAYSLLFGISFGCLMGTKALGLIMVLFFGLVILGLRSKKWDRHILDIRPKSFDWKKIWQFLALSLTGFLITYASIWQVHFSLGKRVVESLPDQGYYQASESHKSLLSAKRTHFPLMLGEHLDFLGHYAKGVPELNLCKADENGSPFFFWPFGARAINYRWETPDGNIYQYIYLQSNPVVWGVALLGILVAFALLVSSVFVPKFQLTHGREILIWFALWASYMIAISQIDRVMYLYHYFIPLLFSFVLFGYVFMELKQIGMLTLTENVKNWCLLSLGILIFAAYYFYRPLSYYEPIGDEAFRKRMVFPLWELHCVHCEKDSLIADPLPSRA